MTCSGYLVFDIETPSLTPNYIHMISTYDLVTRKIDSYVGLEQIAQCIEERLIPAKMLVGHYVEGFDIPVITDLTGVQFDSNKVVDTLHLSRKLCKLPSHGLASWGEMSGLPKLPKPDFTVFTPEMIPYCERDCELTARVFETLLDIMVETDNFPRGYRPILTEYLSLDKVMV